MVETTEGNGADQPRRARSSTERSRAHRATKKAEREKAEKAEREAALQAAFRKTETTECEAAACCAAQAATVEGVAEVVASVENAVAGAAPRPTEPKVEREAAALHEAGEAERAGATETATMERVADRVADVADTVALAENAVAPLKPPEWRILWHSAQPPIVPAFFRRPDSQPPAHDAHAPAQPDEQRAPPAQPGPGALAWCRWTFVGMSVALSFALYFISTFLNMTFWANLNPDVTAKEILAAGGLVVELINYAVPSAISFVPSSQRVLRLVVWGLLCLTMVATAVAGASVVKNSLGASHVSRQENIDKRARYQGIVKSVVAPVSDDAVVDARKRVETAKGVVKTTCAPVRTLDVDECNKAKAEVLKAAAALATENANHASAVTTAEQRHREDVADAEAKLAALSVISVDLDIVAAGVDAIVPDVPGGWVTRGVVALWVLVFALGPPVLLRLGLALLATPRTTSRSRTSRSPAIEEVVGDRRSRWRIAR